PSSPPPLPNLRTLTAHSIDVALGARLYTLLCNPANLPLLASFTGAGQWPLLLPLLLLKPAMRSIRFTRLRLPWGRRLADRYESWDDVLPAWAHGRERSSPVTALRLRYCAPGSYDALLGVLGLLQGIKTLELTEARGYAPGFASTREA